MSHNFCSWCTGKGVPAKKLPTLSLSEFKQESSPAQTRLELDDYSGISTSAGLFKELTSDRISVRKSVLFADWMPSNWHEESVSLPVTQISQKYYRRWTVFPGLLVVLHDSEKGFSKELNSSCPLAVQIKSDKEKYRKICPQNSSRGAWTEKNKALTVNNCISEGVLNDSYISLEFKLLRRPWYAVNVPSMSVVCKR